MTQPKRVLVVDDMDDWRKRVSAVVTACGHEPITANDDIEAEKLLDQGRFDLIITDNKMTLPDSGMELLAGEWYEDRVVPSILHTSEISEDQRLRLQKSELAHVVLVLKSRSSSNELEAAIRKLLP
jgi:CheY-like chemotaxis protein